MYVEEIIFTSRVENGIRMFFSRDCFCRVAYIGLCLIGLSAYILSTNFGSVPPTVLHGLTFLQHVESFWSCVNSGD